MVFPLPIGRKQCLQKLFTYSKVVKNAVNPQRIGAEIIVCQSSMKSSLISSPHEASSLASWTEHNACSLLKLVIVFGKLSRRLIQINHWGPQSGVVVVVSSKNNIRVAATGHWVKKLNGEDRQRVTLLVVQSLLKIIAGGGRKRAMRRRRRR